MQQTSQNLDDFIYTTFMTTCSKVTMVCTV